METHHLRAQLFDQLAAVLVKRRTVGNRGGSLEVGANFCVIRFECQLPAPVAVDIRGGRLVTEKIKVQREARASTAKRDNLGAHLLAREHGTGQGAQAAGLGHRDGQGRAAGAGHGRLEDGQLDAQQIENTTVGPVAHAVLLGAQPYSALLT
ncbi:hypothetical protein D3C79_673890 [compost metagenome]